MATATARKPRKSDLTVSLCLAIDHVAYAVTPIRAEDPDVTRAWRLEKKGADGATYDVATTIHGHQCDCPDWEVRRNGLDPAGCKHVKACVQMGLLDAIATPVVSLAPAVKGICLADTPAPIEPTLSDRCYSCTRLAFLPKLDANGHTVCYECREEPCEICERTGTRRVTRNDGIVVCGECSKRQEEAATLKAFMNTPTPCCQPDEPPACQPCQATTPATDVATAILDRGLALADAEVNQPVSLPDHYRDEAPEGPADSGYAEWQFFRDNPAALPAEPYDPTPEDEADFATFKREGAARDHLDHSDRLTLAELVDRQMDFYFGWDNAVGKMIGQAMEELALKIRMTDATTPDEYEARADSLEADVRNAWESAGYEAGRQAGCRCGEVVLG